MMKKQYVLNSVLGGLLVAVAFFGMYSCEEEKTSTDISPSNPIVSLAVKTPPDVVTYCLGENLTLEGMVLTATLKDGTIRDIGFADFEKSRIRCEPAHGVLLVETFDTLKIVNLTSNITSHQLFTFVTCVYDTIIFKKLPSQVEYAAGDELSLEGLVVEVTTPNGSVREVGYADFPIFGFEATPASGKVLTEADTVISISHPASGIQSHFKIKVVNGLYLPTAYPKPATWPENNVYFISNFVGVEQVNGGDPKSALPDAWVYAGGALDNTTWAIVANETFSYVNLPYKITGEIWGAWMFGAKTGSTFGFSGEIGKYTLVADVKGKGRWLLQLVNQKGSLPDEPHHSLTIDLTEEDGWALIEKPFTAFGTGDFDVSTLHVFKISIENTVTQEGDYIQFTNLRFVKAD